MKWRYGRGQLGLTEASNRLGRCVCNRRRPLHAASVRPGMQVVSLNGTLEGGRKEEDPHHQACLKAQKQQTPVPSKARCFRRGRMGHCSSTCYTKMANGPCWKPKSAQRPQKQ
ncbi:hypothetical protein TRVL_08724 [Trypanosoma vivax]|nr:hypothetical protein TRVL_08724 [Trypanosoma vivax]